MPRLSAFTPFGLLRLSGAAATAEGIYRALVAGLEGAFDMSPGTPAEAEAYATAMAIARARVALARAAAQHDSRSVDDLLPSAEARYGLAPGPTDSIATRQAALRAHRLISRGPREESLHEGLRTLLGAAFVDVRVTKPGERHGWPANPGDGPGLFGRDEVPARRFRFTQSVMRTGAETEFQYEPLGGTTSEERLLVGDALCVEPERLGCVERVTVAAVSGLYARATFSIAHRTGAAMTTGPTPLWMSNQRHVLVVVSDAAASDRPTRQRIHAFMRRISRAPTTWSIVRRSSPTTLGPFRLGTARLGSTPIGTLTLP